VGEQKAECLFINASAEAGIALRPALVLPMISEICVRNNDNGFDRASAGLGMFRNEAYGGGGFAGRPQHWLGDDHQFSIGMKNLAGCEHVAR